MKREGYLHAVVAWINSLNKVEKVSTLRIIPEWVLEPKFGDERVHGVGVQAGVSGDSLERGLKIEVRWPVMVNSHKVPETE